MFWKRQGEREYLIRTTADGSQKSLGRRTSETEEVFKKFNERKDMAVFRLKGLTAALVRDQRMNKALYVGQAPRQLVDALSSLPANAVATSDHALYAYAAAAGVRLRPDLLSSGADLVGLKWEIVDPGPDTVRSGIHLEPLGSRKDYEKAGKDQLTAVVVAKTGHMARMNAISPAELIKRQREASLTGVRAKMEKLGLTPADVEEAVKRSRVKKGLTKKQLAELEALEAMPEEDINFNDIPEITDWAGFEVGKYS